MPAFVELKSARPLVSGAYREVYQHPDNADLLIKVVKPLYIERHAVRQPWYKAWRPAGHYIGLQRELEKYLTLHSRGQQDLLFIQHFAGLLETDRGLGMAVRKVRGVDGELAPTLTAVVRARGLDDDLRERIAALREELIRHHIVFGDISADNIVEADDAVHGRRLVIVDGLSDRLWLPVNALSPWFYRIYCSRRFERMIALLEEIDRTRGAAPGGGVLPAETGGAMAAAAQRLPES